MVKYLVTEQQIDPLCEDDYQNTALHRACAGGSLAVVEFLTSELKKYNPIKELCSDLRNKWKNTPLHKSSVEWPLGYSSILHHAAMKGHIDIVKFLTVEKHCDPML